MKKNDLNPKIKKPVLFSVFPVALIAAFGYFTATTSPAPPEMNISGILADTLPGDTIDDPIPSDTMGYPEDDPQEDTSAYPTEDFFPADTTDEDEPAFDEPVPEPLDTAGSGGGFDDPMPADTNGFNP